MPKVTSGDTVRVHYTGTLDDGSIFDSSEGQEPLEFTTGEGQMIPGFEDAVLGMEPGESKKITIPADQAYGEYDENMVLQFDRAQLPSDMELEVGMMLELQQQGGDETLPVTVVDFTDEFIMLDANHELAGEALTFDIKLVEIVS